MSFAQTQISGQLDLARLLDLSADRLGIAVEYDPALVKGAVTIRPASELTAAELWQFTNRALAAKGFTTVMPPGSDTFSVVKLSDAAAASRIEPYDRSSDMPLPGFRSVLIRTQHRPAKELADPIGKVLSKPGGSVTDLGPSLLSVSDTSAKIEQVMRVLELLDVPSTEVAISVLPVRGMPADRMVDLLYQLNTKRELASGRKLLGELLPNSDGGGAFVIAPVGEVEAWRQLLATVDPADDIATVTYWPRRLTAAQLSEVIERQLGARDPRTEAPWRLSVDEIASTVTVTASREGHEVIRVALERFDTSPGGVRPSLRTFVVKNRDPEEVRSVLEQLLQFSTDRSEEALTVAEPGVDPKRDGVPHALPLPPPPGGSSGQPQTIPSRSSVRSATGDEETRAHMVVDPGTGLLIASGDPGTLSQIEELLKVIDVRQSQVMLEVMMISLSESQAMELGVELEQITISGDIRMRLASLFGLGTRDSAGNRVAGDASGFTGVILSPGDFSVVLRALETINRGRSLSMPKLLVANNQSATINSVINQPYVSINATNTVSTTSFGGSVDAGTQVTIKPQIAEGDSLILDYRISLSSFVGAAPAPSVPPPRQQNSLSSMAMIPDGYTVVLGGIELASDSQGVNQVPGIGNIPFIGELFKTRSKNSSRSRFYVFIRAGVLRQPGFEDLKYRSDRDGAKIDLDDGWPVVEPRVIR